MGANYQRTISLDFLCWQRKSDKKYKRLKTKLQEGKEQTMMEEICSFIPN